MMNSGSDKRDYSRNPLSHEELARLRHAQANASDLFGKLIRETKEHLAITQDPKMKELLDGLMETESKLRIKEAELLAEGRRDKSRARSFGLIVLAFFLLFISVLACHRENILLINPPLSTVIFWFGVFVAVCCLIFYYALVPRAPFTRFGTWPAIFRIPMRGFFILVAVMFVPFVFKLTVDVYVDLFARDSIFVEATVSRLEEENPPIGFWDIRGPDCLKKLWAKHDQEETGICLRPYKIFRHEPLTGANIQVIPGMKIYLTGRKNAIGIAIDGISQ